MANQVLNSSIKRHWNNLLHRWGTRKNLGRWIWCFRPKNFSSLRKFKFLWLRRRHWIAWGCIHLWWKSVRMRWGQYIYISEPLIFLINKGINYTVLIKKSNSNNSHTTLIFKNINERGNVEFYTCPAENNCGCPRCNWFQG